MITPAEREALDNAFLTSPSRPSNDQQMGSTLENWKYLAELYAVSLADMRAENSRLKRKINRLEQKGGGYVGLDK